jgi:hypothetical protein
MMSSRSEMGPSPGSIRGMTVVHIIGKVITNKCALGPRLVYRCATTSLAS